MLLLAFVLACSPSVVLDVGSGETAPESGGVGGGDSGGDDGGSGAGDDSGGGDDGGGDEGGGDGGDGGEDEDPDRIFQLDHVVEIELEISEDDYQALTTDPYTYVPAEVRVDEELFENVGLRVKGRLGSKRILPSKSAFKIDFLEFGEDARLEGLEKLNLNNMVQDCAKVKELAAYGVHELTGTPAAKVAYAQVTLNGENYGLYSLVETYDDEWLKDRFDDPSGNLYDGDYYLYSGDNYYLVDFTQPTDDYFELDEGTDVGLADVFAVTNARFGGGDFQTEVGALIDLEQHARFWAATMWTGQYDSYSYYSNNYRVYFDPARGGRGIFIPWDPDWAFYGSTPLNQPYGTITAGCRDDPTCRAWLSDALDDLAIEIPASDLEARITQAEELIEPYLQDDPKKEQGMGEILGCQSTLHTWFQTRSADLEAAGW